MLVLGLVQGQYYQLVLPLTSLHLVRHEMLLLFHLFDFALEAFDLSFVLLSLHEESLEFFFEPEQLLLQFKNALILSKPAFLILGFLFQVLQFFLDFQHVGFIGSQEILFVPF